MELSQDLRARERAHAREERRSAPRWIEATGPAIALLPLSCLLWLFAVHQVDISRLTDLGLISVLPPAVYIATGILSISFAWTLRGRESSTWLVLIHLAVLIFMLYGIAPMVEHGVTRFAATYKHVGIVDYVIRTGHVDPRIDAYFNWPSFFVWSAFVQQVCGLHDILPVIQWAPVVYNLMYLAPLAAIVHSSTGDRRLVWLAVWFFFMMNWVGQDYYSPQGMAYFLYLTALAIVLTWFRATSRWPGMVHRLLGAVPAPRGPLGAVRRWLAGWVAPPDAPNAYASPAQRLALMIVLVGILVAVVAIHQLTPYAALAALTALAVFNRSSLRSIPVLLFVACIGWIVFVANTYLAGHISQVTGHAFQLGSTVNQNVGSRLAGSAEHLFVVHAALLFTGGIFLLAGLGVLRSIWHGYRDLTYVLLIVAPFGLLALQSYEGEGLLRVYLFALPGVIFFAAALFYVKPTAGRTWFTSGAIVAISVALIGLFYLCRYGNEHMDYFTPAELTAVNHLYDIAPHGSILMAGTDNLPWRFRGYNQYTYAPLDDPSEPTSLPLSMGNVLTALHQVQASMSDPKYSGGYIIFTRSERAYAEMFGIYPHGTYDSLEHAIATSPQFHEIYRNSGAAIFGLAGQPGGRHHSMRGHA